jgi:hypothetical protein
MYRLYLGIVALCLGLGCAAVAEAAVPKVVLHFPHEIASENIQISYFMVGKFGGYGRQIRLKKDQHDFEIDASVTGKPATEVKLIVYMPGCDIVRETIQTEGVSDRRLACRPIQSVMLRGQVIGNSLVDQLVEDSLTGKNRRINVHYSADWSHDFFGIADGPVTAFDLGYVDCDSTGHFKIALPNFAGQNLGPGQFEFTLDDSDGHFLGLLGPAGLNFPNTGLEVWTSYSAIIKFRLWPPNWNGNVAVATR